MFVTRVLADIHDAEHAFGNKRHLFRAVWWPLPLITITFLAIGYATLHADEVGVFGWMGYIFGAVLLTYSAMKTYSGASVYNPIELLRRYYLMNIRGFTAWVCQDPDSEPGTYSMGQGLKYLVVPRGQLPDREHLVNDRIFILMPLGGLFARPHIRQVVRADTIGLLELSPRIEKEAWKIRFSRGRWVNRHLSTVVLGSRKQKNGVGPHYPCWCGYTLKTALEIIEKYHHHGVDMEVIWFEAMIQKDHRMNMIELSRKRQIDILKRYIDMIWSKSRFGPSKGGKEVREAMTEELLQLLPEDDPSRAEYESGRRPARLQIA